MRGYSLCLAVLFLLVATLFGCGGEDATGPKLLPSVSIEDPDNGAEVSGTITIRVIATNADDVQIRLDGRTLANLSSSPYTYEWDTSTSDNGSHEIRAAAGNDDGFAEDVVSVLVNNASGGVGVQVLPTMVSLGEGESQQFTATVVGDANTAVTWSVDGGSPNGTVSASGLYTAPNPLPAANTATVRATSVADASKSATAEVTFTRSGITVTITPSGGSVALGETQNFTATVEGTNDTSVIWSVIGGAAFGSITQAGVYTAPSALPNPAEATIQAVSQADNNAVAQVTIGLESNSPLTANQIDLLRGGYLSGWSLQDLIRESNLLSAQAIFLASDINGNQVTLVGTLTETAPDVFSYSSSPTDRMRVIFLDGRIYEIVINDAQGPVGDLTYDDHEAFLDIHSIFDYNFTGPGASLRVQSQSVPADEFNTTINQGVEGTVELEGQTWEFSGTVTGNKLWILASQSSTARDDLEINGMFESGSNQIEIAQTQFYRNEFFSMSGDNFIESSDDLAMIATDGTDTIVLSEVNYSWSDTDERDPIYMGSGQLLLNSKVIGDFAVDSNSGQSGVVLLGGEIITF